MALHQRLYTVVIFLCTGLSLEWPGDHQTTAQIVTHLHRASTGLHRTRFLCPLHFVQGSSVYFTLLKVLLFIASLHPKCDSLKSWWLWPSNWNANCTSLLLSSSILSPYFQEHSIIIWGLRPSRLYPVSLIADYQGFGICLAFVHLLLVLVYWDVFGICAGW